MGEPAAWRAEVAQASPWRDLFLDEHGANRRHNKFSGHKLIFVPFANGRPSEPLRDIPSAFAAAVEHVSCGRPVGVAVDLHGSVLMADSAGDVIWRVTG